MKNILATLLFSLLIFSACKKEDSGDGTKPVIIVNGFNPVYWALDIPYEDAGAEAYDVTDSGDTISLTSDIVTQINVDVSVVGDYTVTYNVKDESGLAADQKERAVKVVLGK